MRLLTRRGRRAGRLIVCLMFAPMAGCCLIDRVDPGAVPPPPPPPPPPGPPTTGNELPTCPGDPRCD